MKRWILPAAVAAAFIAGVAIAFLPGRDRRREANDAPAQRVVALTTAGVEMLFALGAQDKLVGVTDYAVFPPAAVATQNCGGWADTNFEVISKLQPDLIIVQGVHQSARDFAARRGVRLLSLKAGSVNGIFDDIMRLGKAVGREKEARELTARISRGLDAVSAAVKPEPPVPAAIVTAKLAGTVRKISVCGGGTFVNELLAVAGGKNVFEDTKGYVTVSREILLARAPQVILDMRPGETPSSEDVRKIVCSYDPLASLPAVRENRVYVVTDPSALTAGPRIHEIVRAVAELLHPGIDWGKVKIEPAFRY